MKKIYIPIALRKAAEEAAKKVMEKYQVKSTYVPFDNGKSVRRKNKSFDTYFLANNI